ncbi:MAG: PF20097 family protein [Ruminococcus sp.]|nr:PF20097 family protein [Ruminococcus sp.]
MKCPECAIEMKKGNVRVETVKSITQALTFVMWTPEGNFKTKDVVNLELNAEGYYCDTCMKVWAAFEEKYLW